MERVGFIGLGIMGRPMARHLLEAGYALTVLRTGKPAMIELVAAGAEAVNKPSDVGARSDIVITMLPDSAIVEQVALGEDGVLEAQSPGSIFIDMSTTIPAVARKIADAAKRRDGESLDAPVSGGQVGAENATLAIMVGGAQAAFDRANPIFERMGKNITRVGDAGAGQIAKAANQIIVGVTIAAVSEALVLAAKAGVDPARVREALMGGFASSRILELHGKRMIERNFAPGAKMTIHRKDMDIILRTARELNVALPISASVAELMDSVIANGGGELDHSALVTVFEQLSHKQVDNS